MGSSDSPAKTPMIVLYEEQVLGPIIFLIAIIGTTANVIVTYFTRKLPTMNNPFGRLTASQACGEAILCGTFAFYFAPMMIFDVRWMKENSAQAGFINLICYDICIWSHLFISLNRLSAIVFPFQYERIFSRKNTWILIVISWVVPIVTAIALYKIHICDFYYSEVFWAFVFTQSEVCNFISWNIDFYKDISIVIVIACVDIVTIYHVHRTRLIGSATSTQIARRRKEVNFLKQCVLQGMVFVVELLTYFIFAWKMENRFAVWSLTTLAWNLVHTTDGIIIIVFNREFRKLVTKPLRHLVISGNSSTAVRELQGIQSSTALPVSCIQHSAFITE